MYGMSRQRSAWVVTWFALVWSAFWTIRSLIICTAGLVQGKYDGLGLALMILPFHGYLLYWSISRIRAKSERADKA